jgi:hypothetical protein
MDVVDKIMAVPRDERDNPLEPIMMMVTVKEQPRLLSSLRLVAYSEKSTQPATLGEA